ncbi:MAG TPA: alginate lyase family protein [Bacteroidales bacterium]|nr:alginate lyase family protein [Bacteroidales bacterium]
MQKMKMIILLFFFIGALALQAQPFIHPGLLHSKEDLERMKMALIQKQEPIYSGYLKFIQNPVSQSDYKMLGPLPMVGRNPTVGQKEYDSDANAAHQNAIMWCLTGNRAFADKAIEILNAWSSTLKSITGRDAVLMAGLGPFKMVNAAEIIRYTNAGWDEKDIRQTEQNFKEVIYPVIKDFAPFANGNWDAAAIKTMMAIGVFCNDRYIFERALRYYEDGWGNGSLTHYIINEEGQIQESGRDQAHTQLGIAMLAECSEIAWHQGLDLYGYDHNRLLKGFEYVAKFNLGNDDVPFEPWVDRTGKYIHTVISQSARNRLRAVYEQIYNHYVNRMKLQAPFVTQAVARIRPEGPGNPGADHPGYGTLYYSQSARSETMQTPATGLFTPGGIIATGTAQKVTLRWVASVGATGYVIKRAETKNGLFTIIGTTSSSDFIDSNVIAGTTYYYTISAQNHYGTSEDSYAASINAGLPYLWKEQTIGKVGQKGSVGFDGQRFTIEGAGMGIDSVNSSYHYFYHTLSNQGALVVRFVPQPSSQFTSFGLMVKKTVATEEDWGALIIRPEKTGAIESPDWQVHLLSKTAVNAKGYVDKFVGSLNIPTVTFGRLTGEYWLKLTLNNGKLTATISENGTEWLNAGTLVWKANSASIGIVVASGIESRTTQVQFDHVNFSKSTN